MSPLLVWMMYWQAMTGGQGVDIVLEMLANVNLEEDMKLTKTGGQIAVSMGIMLEMT